MAAIFVCGLFDAVSAGNGVLAAVLGLIGAFFLSYFVQILLGQRRRGYLVLSDRGVLQRGMAFSSFLPWEAFGGVSAAYNGRPEVLVLAYQNARWTNARSAACGVSTSCRPVPMIEIDLIHFTVDANLMYHLIRFYVDNPAARAELGTQACLDRARAAAYL